MSKELIVSSGRHETRVAILDDDQVVELFHEREKEYSLAGSIHKGRVTRVLPGMQSAFVDIGLDRDAFLYVSDFFEDNEEYDKVVSSVEDTVPRLEKGSAAALPLPPPAAVSPAVEAADAEPPAAPARAPQVTNGQPAVAASEPRTEGRDNRGDRDNRRGPRSRRRRGRGGRGGLPESKYFSPKPRQEAPAGEVAAAAETEEEFSVLPGESLAKYGTERPNETPAPRNESAAHSFDNERPEDTGAEAEDRKSVV